MLDEVQIDSKLKSYPFRMKFTPTLYSLHTDFKTHFKALKCKDKSTNFWHNPYMILQTNRELLKNKLNLGYLCHLGNWYYENNRIEISKKEEQTEGCCNYNARLISGGVLTKNKFFLGYLLDTCLNFKQSKKRAVQVGYQKDKFLTTLQFEQNRVATYKDWKFDEIKLQMGMDFEDKGFLGVELKKNCSSETKEGEESKRNDVLGTLGYEKSVNEKLFVKGKFDSKLNATVFWAYKVLKNLEI